MKFHITLAILLSLSFVAQAAPTEPLKFKTWKEQQIMEAQNEVLRISARLRIQKNTPKTDTPEVSSSDLKNARETLQIAKEFTIEDYADVYVANLQDDPDQFSKLMNSLTKDEMAQLMKVLVKNKASEIPEETNDAKRGKATVSPTLASSTPRA